MFPFWLGAGLKLGLALGQPATQPVIDVHWDVPEACALKSDFLRQWQEFAGRQRRPEVRVEIAIVSEPGERWRLDLSIVAGGRVKRKRLRAGSCGELVTSAALLLEGSTRPPSAPRDATLQAQVHGPTGEAPIKKTPPANPPPTKKNTPPTPPSTKRDNPPNPKKTPPQPPPTQNPPPKIWSNLSANLTTGSGIVPGLGIGTQLALTLGINHFVHRAELGHTTTPSTRQATDPHRFHAIDLRLLGCARLQRARFAWPLCLGGVARRLYVQVDPPLEPLADLPARDWSLGLVAHAGVEWRIHPRLGLLLAVDGLWNLRRPRFLLEGRRGAFSGVRELELYGRAGVALYFGRCWGPVHDRCGVWAL